MSKYTPTAGMTSEVQSSVHLGAAQSLAVTVLFSCANPECASAGTAKTEVDDDGVDDDGDDDDGDDDDDDLWSVDMSMLQHSMFVALSKEKVTDAQFEQI